MKSVGAAEYNETEIIRHKRGKAVYALVFVLVTFLLIVALSFLFSSFIKVGSNLPLSFFSLTLKEKDYYAISSEEFISEAEAGAHARTIKQRGGAGFLMKRDTNFTVIVAVYNNMDDCILVKENLLTQGLRAEIFTITMPKKSISGLNNTDRTNIKAVYEYFFSLYKTLYNISAELDKGSKKHNEAALDFAALKLETIKFNLEIRTSANKYVTLIKKQLNSVIDIFEYLTNPIVTEGRNMPYTSEIKYAYTQILFYCAEINNL